MARVVVLVRVAEPTRADCSGRSCRRDGGTQKASPQRPDADEDRATEEHLGRRSCRQAHQAFKPHNKRERKRQALAALNRSGGRQKGLSQGRLQLHGQSRNTCQARKPRQGTVGPRAQALRTGPGGQVVRQRTWTRVTRRFILRKSKVDPQLPLSKVAGEGGGSEL